MSAELRVGYQQAALLGAWTLEQEAKVPVAYTFRAVVASTHPYWILQQPLDLVVALGQTEWRWTGVPLVIDGDTCVAELRTRPVVAERQVVLQREGDQR